MGGDAIVRVFYRSGKMRKVCSQKVLLAREYGPEIAAVLGRRLEELGAADSLEDMGRLPAARCHELSGRRKGQLAVDLRHPFRLIFEPAQLPVPRRPDGGLDWSRVTEVVVLEIVDYH
jgi:proteic killer suppression protein